VDDPAALAAEAERLLGISPREAVQAAEQAIRAARREHNASVESRARRTMGRAHKELGELPEAIRSLRLAVTRAKAAGDLRAVAEAEISLAWLLFERGQTVRALAQADLAGDALHGATDLRLLGQRAALYQRSGRFTEALECYKQALPLARATNAVLDEARLLNNRGVLYIWAGRLAEAEVDTLRAAQLHTELGQEVYAADTRWNLGVIASRRGDVPAALRVFDETEATYRKHDLPLVELLVTRGELELSVGLLREARETAAQALSETVRAGRSMLQAEALLLAAQASLASDAAAAALVAAGDAARLFGQQKRPGWAALARYVGLRAEERADRPAGTLRRRALRVAAELAAVGWRAQELDARLIAARSALDRGDRSTARRELAAAATARTTGPLDLRIRAWYAEALRRLADGERASAERALMSGMKVLDQHRGMLGATELRVHLAGHASDVAMLGMSLALETGSARRSLDWAERWRARALWHPIRPPQDPELAKALAELRRVTAEVEEALLGESSGGRAVARLQSRKAAIEEQVRRLARHEAGSLYAGQAKPPTVPALAAALGDRVLVEIVRLQDDLVAVTVRDGAARLHRLGDLRQVRRNVESLLFALRRMALGHGTAASLAGAKIAAERAAARIDEELLGPVAKVLADRPLVLIPPGELQALPWSVLPRCQRVSVTVALSAAVWLRASTAPTAAGSPPAVGSGPVLLVAGPGLEGATREIAELAQAYGAAVPLTAGRATVERVLAGLDGAAVAHIAAHGRVRSDNPLFSALELADGPLTVYDLESLDSAPRLVLLPACQSGVGQVLAGDEMMGLTAALFALGTRTIVATVIPVPDEATRPLMLALHDRLRHGLPPAEALAQARAATVDPDDPSSVATAAGFVCFGAS